MTTGQRLILGLCALALGAYLVFLAARVTGSGSGTSTDDAAGVPAGPVASEVSDAVAELAAIGLSLEPYRHGVIKPEGATIRTERDGEHGFGIFFMPAESTRNRVVRFSATGDARVIIRTTVSGERHYMNASSEDFMKITPQTDEVLIFTEEASHIDVQVRSISDCDTIWDTFCADEAYLAEKIGISGKSEPNKEELLQILDWTANSIVWSGDRAITAEGNELVKKYTAPQMFATVFEPETAGGFCGAAGVFLSKVLNDLGYQAMTINFGTGPELTHVSTLVYDPFGDGKFYMVDPTFNAIFVDEQSGAWIPFDDLLAGKTEGALILERSVEARRFLTRKPNSGHANCRPAKGRSDVQVCSRPGYNFETYMRSFGNAFAEAGMSPDKAGYMHMLRQRYFNVGNQAGGDVRDRFIALLKRNDIPFDG